MLPSKRKPTPKRPDVPSWLDEEDSHHRRALERASRHFDKKDVLDVHTLEAVYGKESSFGHITGKRNSELPAGDFQMSKDIAKKMGLHVSEENDERFDLDASSAAAAKHLKSLDDHFSKPTVEDAQTKTVPINDAEERKKFDLAAYHAGEARIAKAQALAQAAGDDPTKWEDVQKYLEKAGEKKELAKDTREYVNTVLRYEKEFRKGSKANADQKSKKGEPVDPYPSGGHWITKDGRHIFIKD